ncbi:MAG: protein kinase, partial [Candidatus Obscuribacterales bacterium]
MRVLAFGYDSSQPLVSNEGVTISSGENQQPPPASEGAYGRPIPQGAEFAAGTLVGGTYEIVDYLGRGAMGFVYRARHNILGREYALKTLGGDQISDTSWRRFQIEAQAIAKMSHPNVVGIHNFALHHREGQTDIPFYVMDLLEGSNLMERLRDNGTPPLAILLSIFQQAAAGLGYAHSKGMIHRDVKPGNIVLLNSPDAVGATVKIVDFGIAKLTDAQYGAQKLTTAGEVFGSPLYMSPEQSMAQTLDQRTDIYSLGVTLFEALVGDPPFIANSAVEVMMMHQSAPVPIINSVSEVGYPPEVQQVVEKMMAKVPEDRYQAMDQVVADLAAIARGQEPALGAYRLSDTGRFEHRSSTGDSAGGDALRDTRAGRVGATTVSGPLLSTTVSSNRGALDSQELDEEPEEKTARAMNSIFIGLASVAVIASVAVLLLPHITDWLEKNSSPADRRVGSADGERKITSGKSKLLEPSTGEKVQDASDGSSANLGFDEASAVAALGKNKPKVTSIDDSARNDFAAIVDMSSKRLNAMGGVQKPPTGSQNENFKYSSLVVVKGVKIRRFNFPNDISIGHFSGATVESTLDAKGTVDLIAGVEYAFIPNRSIEQYPQYLKRFRSGDIRMVSLWPYLCRDKLLDAVSYIPGVQKLTISKDDGFTAASFSRSLGRFKSLSEFEASAIDVGGSALAAANCWSQLEKLKLREVHGLGPLLEKLQSSSKLTELTIRKSRLSHRDIELIASLHQLVALDLGDNKLSMDDLRLLAKLSRLKFLAIRN